MSALIIRLPQEKRDRLQQVAKERKLSVNKLIEEMATVAIAEHDAEVRFQVRAARGRRGGAAVALSSLAPADATLPSLAAFRARLRVRGRALSTEVVAARAKERA